MFKIRVWDRRCTNFGANRFVNERGTNQIEIEQTRRAVRFFNLMVAHPDVDRVVLECPEGNLEWQQVHTCLEV